MRGEIRRRAAGVAVLVLALLPVAACAGPGERVPVPSFASPQVVAGVGPNPAVDDIGIPDDCDRIMPTAELVALLGLALDSVVVRTTIGIPEPSVGRVERVACRYYSTQGGITLLELNAGRYVDEASATRQWRVNTGVERGARRPVPFGTADAVLIERPDEALLSVVNRDIAVTMTLPSDAPRPPGRTAADSLVDIALRVLAVVTPAVPRELSTAG